MSDNRFPMLDLLYQQYLTDESSAGFIHAVSTKYSIGTLERLARFGSRLTRRASILAIGFLGDFTSNDLMGNALVDRDRAVRLLADHGIREIWQRQGTDSQQQMLQSLYRMNAQSRIVEAIDVSTTLINLNPNLGEAWNQRAIAYCAQGEFEAGLEDCQETLNCNPFHFPAAMGLAHCYMHLDDAFAALEAFRLALKINPDLEGVRNHVSHLERIVDDF